MKRRDFLKFGGMALGAAGAAGLPLTVRATMDQDYESAILAEKPVYRPDGWKGARVNYLEYPGGSFDINNPRQVDLNGCASLGSSTIVGPIARRREIEGGFKRFDTGYYGDPAELRKKAGAQYYSPMGDALVFGARATGTEAMVDGTPRADKLPIPDPVTMARHIKIWPCSWARTTAASGCFPSRPFTPTRPPRTRKCATACPAPRKKKSSTRIRLPS